MPQINWNTRGPLDHLPVVERIDNYDGPIQQHWFVDPGVPWRLIQWMADGYPLGQQMHVRWQDQELGARVPGPGAHEANDPGGQVQPPDAPPLEIVYRFPEVRRTQNGHFVDEFGRRWRFKMCDGYPDFANARAGKDVAPILAQRKALGFNGCRTFFSGDKTNNGFWDIRVFDAAWLRDAEAYLRMLKDDYGLYCEATFANLNFINPTVEGQRAMFTAFWEMAAQFGSVIGEYSNESEDGDNGVHTEVCVRVPGILLSGGSSQSDYPPPKPYLDWTGHHSKRGDFTNPADVASCLDAMNLMHVQAGFSGQGAGLACVPVLNESMKAAQFEKPGSRTMNATYFYRLGVGTSTLGGMTFASEAGGMYGILLDGPELKCAEACIAGMNGLEWDG